MIHIENEEVRNLILTGNFGLEKESLRVDEEGYMSHLRNPFPGDEHIVRDFCENQTEINTGVSDSPDKAVAELTEYYRKIQRKLKGLPNREYLWPFSNPPYIKNEDDIPVAVFDGDKASKTEYRNYLSDRYGRYKMTLSGIHFNFSFSDELLQKDFAISGEKDFVEYKNQLYVTLAERVAEYGWLLVALTAASPVCDRSYNEKGQYGDSMFYGLASLRCSEIGYWNFFAPVFDYSNINAYADSINSYVDDGYIKAPTELYYPVRLKPAGKNSLKALKENGVNHIELRMFDLNPLVPCGIDVRDIKFAHLLLVYLACTPRQAFDKKAQVQAVQNFKNAAHYDLKTVKIVVPDGEVYTVVQAAKNVFGFLREFYKEYPKEVIDILDFEEEKIDDTDKRYAWIIRKEYAKDFVKSGIVLAKARQEEADV
jgi:glutamate--cysteine ligase